MEDTILWLVEDFLPKVEFEKVYMGIAIGFLLLWICVSVWAWRDARSRYKSWVVPILIALFVLVFFVFGYLAYLILRPKDTVEERYWMEREKEYLMHEIGEYDICPNCKYDQIYSEFLRCPNCGHELKFKCESCSFALTKFWKHCPSCGKENSHYDALGAQSPNEVLIGQLDKRDVILNANAVETKAAIIPRGALSDANALRAEAKMAVTNKKEEKFPSAKKKLFDGSRIKFIVGVYANFFRSVGAGFSTMISGMGKLALNTKNSVASVFASKKSSPKDKTTAKEEAQKKNQSIDASVQPAEDKSLLDKDIESLKNKKKAQRRKKRKRKSKKK